MMECIVITWKNVEDLGEECFGVPYLKNRIGKILVRETIKMEDRRRYGFRWSVMDRYDLYEQGYIGVDGANYDDSTNEWIELKMAEDLQ